MKTPDAWYRQTTKTSDEMTVEEWHKLIRAIQRDAINSVANACDARAELDEPISYSLGCRDCASIARTLLPDATDGKDK